MWDIFLSLGIFGNGFCGNLVERGGTSTLPPTIMEVVKLPPNLKEIHLPGIHFHDYGKKSNTFTLLKINLEHVLMEVSKIILPFQMGGL